MAAVCWLVLLDMLPELADDLGVAEKNLERRLHRAATRPHPGPHTHGAVVCRRLLMLHCCTGGLLSLEMLIGDYRRCNYEHEIAMGWWSTDADARRRRRW